MIPYYGKNSLKQHIKGKPIRFGYKQWVIATPLGYACRLEPYHRAGTGFDKQYSLGYGVVMGLVGHLPQGPWYHVFFISLRLLKGLSDLGIAATGTIRSNRTEKCPIDIKALNKRERGSFDFRHDREDDLIVCSWNDNSVVTLASNNDNVEPLAKTYLKLLKVQEHLPPVVRTQQAKRQKVVPEVCHSGIGHHLRSMPKQRRCNLCGKKANMLCGACNVPLYKKYAEELHI
ncbi:hypothetical protein RRG08_008872 [Elysia crispata]|uniref:PiggyBac transposable element-derived protein domain-containing protein n=1 Tax=Elysia crispata TaxID=231223 RepID=A0AAE1DNM9_9GAST|nr:hypothetical protein RRG08_008872 [Elysia crispata]